jgi:hypothetical protein
MPGASGPGAGRRGAHLRTALPTMPLPVSELPLADKLSAWAEEELRLPSPPSPAVLSELTKPPRAAALFNALVARARAPKHVAAARAAAALLPLACDGVEGGEDAGILRDEEELRHAQQEAVALEDEVAALRARVSSGTRAAGKRRMSAKADEGRQAVRAIQAALAEALREEHRAIERARDAIASVQQAEATFGGGMDGAGAATGAVRAALADLETTAQSRRGQDEAAAALAQSLEAAAGECDIVHVLDALVIAAEEDLGRMELDERGRTAAAEEKSAQRCSLAAPRGRAAGAAGEHADSGVESVLEELRLHQMDMFMEAEDAASTALEAEHEVAEAMRRTQSAGDEMFLAELAGEHAAIAEIDRLERELRMCRSREAAARDAEVERASALSARADAARATAAAHDELLARVARERRRLLQTFAKLESSLGDHLLRRLPETCAAAVAAAVSRQAAAQERVARAASLSFERDARVLVEGAWQPIDDLAVLAEEAGGAAACATAAAGADGITDDSAVRVLEELEQSVAVGTMHRDALLRELERDTLTANALESRAVLVGDALEREREAQDDELCPRLEAALDAMRDCNTRLVPAARNELRVWATQPVRDVAPWHRVKGRTLREWELQAVQLSSANGGSVP